MLQEGDLVEIIHGPLGVARREEYEGQIGTIVRFESVDGSAYISAPRKSSNIEDKWYYNKSSFRPVQMPSYDCDSAISSFLEDF